MSLQWRNQYKGGNWGKEEGKTGEVYVNEDYGVVPGAP